MSEPAISAFSRHGDATMPGKVLPGSVIAAEGEVHPGPGARTSRGDIEQGSPQHAHKVLWLLDGYKDS